VHNFLSISGSVALTTNSPGRGRAGTTFVRAGLRKNAVNSHRLGHCRFPDCSREVIHFFTIRSSCAPCPALSNAVGGDESRFGNPMGASGYWAGMLDATELANVRVDSASDSVSWLSQAAASCRITHCVAGNRDVGQSARWAWQYAENSVVASAARQSTG